MHAYLKIGLNSIEMINSLICHHLTIVSQQLGIRTADVARLAIHRPPLLSEQWGCQSFCL